MSDDKGFDFGSAWNGFVDSLGNEKDKSRAKGASIGASFGALIGSICVGVVGAVIGASIGGGGGVVVSEKIRKRANNKENK